MAVFYNISIKNDGNTECNTDSQYHIDYLKVNESGIALRVDHLDDYNPPKQ
ncbi:hypothetical protein GCM10023313_40740 [Mucilaginibacter defluvii]|uniref:Uncharacterized protein n=1 Tax=Mucilaginibacter defluvii TaxID=1196019 RepID=A0ABP9GGB2_9SPHI